jgi:hypothetical protein
MAKKIKIEVKKPAKRIPVPKKPPKIEEGRKQYDRKKEKEKSRELFSGE